MTEHEPKITLVQTFTEEYHLYVVDDKGQRLAAIPLGTNDRKEAGKKADSIIGCVMVAGEYTEQA